MASVAVSVTLAAAPQPAGATVHVARWATEIQGAVLLLLLLLLL